MSLVALLCALLANLTPSPDKAVVFAAAFLPQFVPSHALVLAMLPLLALVWVLVETRRAGTQGWSGW